MRPHLGHTVTRALYQKEHYLTDCSDVIFQFLTSKNAQKSKFSGAPPRTPLGGELTGRAYIASLDLLKGTRCPLPNNPIPVLGLSIRPRFYGSQGQTHYKVVNRKYDY